MQINQDQLILAPMEGVMDNIMRQLLLCINPFTLCITEFVRVVDSKAPNKTFYKKAPELHHQAELHQTPIRVQLLGQDPYWMAENALTAINLGSKGIDLNFGCPAKTVNKRKGGAILLNEPEQIYQIVHNVRQAVPSNQAVSVKIRLGYLDDSLLGEIVSAIDSAKASMLTIHARTKAQGYKPPANWHAIAYAKKFTQIPIVANGDIFQLDDAINCKAIAQTQHLMLGRGVLSMPNLGQVIANNVAPMIWPDVVKLLFRFSELELEKERNLYFVARLKQWLVHLKRQYPEAKGLFDNIRTLMKKDEIIKQLHRLCP